MQPSILSKFFFLFVLKYLSLLNLSLAKKKALEGKMGGVKKKNTKITKNDATFVGPGCRVKPMSFMSDHWSVMPSSRV